MFDTLNLNAACAEQHKAVIEKGFTPQPVATNLMLIVSELGEACEADRKNRHANLQRFLNAFNKDEYDALFNSKDEKFKSFFETAIKDTFEDEIADAFLRLMDLCGAMNIDIEKHIRMKAEYNLTREPKHGKAY